jgi:type II secretory pathway pseudopilin PulG
MATEYFDRMKIRSDAPRSRSTAEDGYVLVAVMFMLAILVLSLAVAAPRIKQALERDRELEAMNRGKQYIRAIRLYYKKFNAYPPNIEALENTNNLRFLRKRYVDPITGKDDWRPILLGQNKVPTVMGFFGQALPIASISGTGPGGAGIGSPLNSSSAVSNETTDPTIPPPDSTGNQSSTSPGSTTGQAFGGAGIIGFSIPSEKQSILVYKKQSHFNMWEFVYDPMQEMALSAGPGAGAGAGTGAGTTAAGNSAAPGSSPGNPPAVGGLPTGMAPLQPQCGGKWSPNGSLPTPCPE